MQCPNPNYVWPKGKVIAVPCGKCIFCLSNKRNDWAFRLMQEYKVSSSAYFVTLTYSDRFVPEHGVSKRHLQLYFKRLRKLCSTKIRYYAVGEYGGQTLRPHYHAIIFNADERSIRMAWTFRDRGTGKVYPIGIVHCGSVTEASVQYTLKYVVQSREEIPEGIRAPFALMSRGYGLGAHYLTDAMIEWHRIGQRVYAVRYGEKLRLPRFYKDKIWPASEWSDWIVRRENVLKKSRMEADEKRAKEDADLIKRGKDPELVRKVSSNALASRIKTKVAFTQKL